MSKKKNYVTCPACGEKVSSEFNFCTNCRYPLKKKKNNAGLAGLKDYIIAACIVAVAAVLVVISCDFGVFRTALTTEQIPTDMNSQPINTASGDAVTAEPEVTAPPATMEPTAAPTQPPSNRGTAAAIPEDVREFMSGKSMTPNNNIGFDDLAYLTVPYWDFNDERQEGHMVVAAELADEVLDIFSELYDVKYPIERMELVDYFFDKQTETLNSPDRASMGNNNTSAFYYRVVSGTNTLSKHALGRAIDINTKVNPFVNGSHVSPANAYKYADRSQSGWTDVEKRAYIGKDTEIYRIFRKYGWVWGGEIWSYQDYQHFQKP